MTEPEIKQTRPKGKTAGVVLIALGLGLGLFAYAHRPVDGLMDAILRDGSWVFKPGPYYVVLFIAASSLLAGILRTANRMKAPNIVEVPPSEESDLDRIRKAKELLDAGAIDAADFEKIKKSALKQ